MTEDTASPIPPPPVIHMTPEQFTAWCNSLGLGVAATARTLGICTNTLRSYQRGRHIIPKYIMLACELISARRNLGSVNQSEQVAA